MARMTRLHAMAALAATAVLIPRPGLPQEAPTAIRVGSLAADTYAEAFYALDLGLFSQAQLAVEIIPFSNGGAMASAVAGGSIDIGIADASELANGRNRGIPFVLIAGGGLYTSSSPTSTMCVAKSSSITRASDLEGQSVAIISLVALVTAAVKSWLVQSGADLAKIRFLELPMSQMPPALERGTVAAAVISEPVMSAALRSDIRILGKPFDSIGKRYMTSEWFTTADWLSKHIDAAKRFAGAIYAAGRWANSHHDESARILAKYAKLDAAGLAHVNRCEYALDLQPALIQPVLDTALTFKVLETATNARSLIAKGF